MAGKSACTNAAQKTVSPAPHTEGPQAHGQGTRMAFEPYPWASNEDRRVNLVEHVPEGGEVISKIGGYLTPKPGSPGFPEYVF